MDEDSAEALLFSPQDRTILAAGGHAFRIWDLDARKRIAYVRDSSRVRPANTMAFSPDGKTVAFGDVPVGRIGSGEVTLWDVKAGKEVAVLRPDEPEGRYSVESIAFSPDGSKLAITGKNFAGVDLWDVAGRKLIGVFASGGSSNFEVAFTADGKSLVAGGSNGLHIWDLATGRRTDLLDWDGVFSSIIEFSISPDGKTIATAGSGNPPSFDRDTEDVRIVDLTAGRQVDAIRVAPVDVLAFSPDGRTFAVTKNKTVNLWDIPTRRQITSIPVNAPGVFKKFTAMAFSHDGAILALGGLPSSNGGSALHIMDVSRFMRR